jgi:hypothetical protein
MFGRGLLAAAMLLIVSGSAMAAEGFGPFREEPINAPDSYKVLDDPTGEAPTPKVDSFTILPGACNDQSKYHDGKSSDCTFKSVRSQVYQPKPDQTQPKESWYAWSMYMAKDFPLGIRQTKGLYSFAYWHNQDCPHVAIVSDTGKSTKLRLQTNSVPKDGSNDCIADTQIEFADALTLRGKWHRFEAHIKWSQKDDGFAELFIDGNQVVDFKGRTLSAETPKPNYFKYGIYLCCTKGTETVVPATVLYADVVRAKTRAGLSR